MSLPKQYSERLAETVAKSVSLYTELVESCEWDYDDADTLIALAAQVVVDLYEYSAYDKQQISNIDDFKRLFKLNLTNTTEIQKDILIKIIEQDIIDYHKNFLN